MKDLRTGGLATGAVASTVTGDGSNGSPFVAPCANPGLVDCTVTAFKTRLLTGLWTNEYVPAYRCPSDHPYLTYGRYVPDGVLVPPGVQITSCAGCSPGAARVAGFAIGERPPPRT